MSRNNQKNPFILREHTPLGVTSVPFSVRHFSIATDKTIFVITFGEKGAIPPETLFKHRMLMYLE